MLNAEGGEIWVGLREEEGRAVAVERIENVERELQALADYLADVVEPPLGPKELIDLGAGRRGRGESLRIVVTRFRSGSPTPFCGKEAGTT